MKSNAKIIYSLFNNKPNYISNGMLRWNNIFPDIQSKEWKDIFRRSFLSSRETGLQSMQYRILNYVVTCKKKLHEMRIVDSPLCTACNNVDNHVHFFVECLYVKNFWETLFEWLNQNLGYTLTVDVKLIIMGFHGFDDTTIVQNFIILLAKYYIYTKRINDIYVLNLSSFKALLKQKLDIEKSICESTILHQFNKFEPLFNLLAS